MALHGERRLFELAPDGGRRIIDIDQARLDSLELAGLYAALFGGALGARACWLRAPRVRWHVHTLLRPEAASSPPTCCTAPIALVLRTQLLGAGRQRCMVGGRSGATTVVLRVDGEGDLGRILRSAWRSIRLSTPAVAVCLLPMQPDAPPGVVQQMVAFQPPVEARDANGSCGERNWRCRAFRLSAVRFCRRGRAGSWTAGRRTTPAIACSFGIGGLPELRWYLDGKLIGEGSAPGGIPGPALPARTAAPTASRSTRSSSQPRATTVEPLSG